MAHSPEVTASDNALPSSVLDSPPVAITVTGSDDRWLRVNHKYCRLLGYESKELFGASFDDFSHPNVVAEDRRRRA